MLNTTHTTHTTQLAHAIEPTNCNSSNSFNQQEIWMKEHQTKSDLPSMANKKPTQGVIDLVEYFGINWFKNKKVVDIGCGKGRNSVYLAYFEAKIYAIDYIQYAIDVAIEFAKEERVEKHLNFYCQRIDRAWPFENDFFDLGVDSFASIDIETIQGRVECRDELYRTLKPNGYALILVVSNEDEFEKKLIAAHPATEKNSCFWPTTGKFQKDYSESELMQFYQDGGFKIVQFKKVEKPSFKMNQHFQSITFWLLIQKIDFNLIH